MQRITIMAQVYSIIKMENYICKHWKVSDRLSVIQLKTKDSEYKCEQTNGTHLQITKVQHYTSKVKRGENIKINITKTEERSLITILNVYAPTSEIAKTDPAQVDELYMNINNLISEYKNRSTLLLIAGDFNSKIGKTTGTENCIGKYSKGARNTPGQHLIDFCELNELFITNSAFKHPSRHITTWEKSSKQQSTYQNDNNTQSN